MKKEIRDALAKGYVDEYEHSVRRRSETFLALLNSLRTAARSATEKLMQLEIALSRFPIEQEGRTISTFWKWRASRKSSGSLRLYLKCNERIEGRLQSYRKAILPDAEPDVIDLLTSLLGKRLTTEFLNDLGDLLHFSERVSRWAHTLGMPLDIDVVRFGSVISAWVGAIERLGGSAPMKLETLIGRFELVDSELQEALIEFNQARQPVRYRSIICRQDVGQTDPLGPSQPIFRVVRIFNRVTGARKTEPIEEFKRSMLRAEMKASLAKELGRNPTPGEVAEAIGRQKRRPPTQWITSDVISHCYLGKHSGSILRQQKTIAASMDEWLALRGLFQALL
ncbi:hypothetical protein QMA79_18850 [Pseudomonas aeruginosa]|uniref:hypothetical protein n=1 Tax=Pseudomonas aeruginosa TaxID=287 RepID=UPI0024AD34CD|nr:hypothetical protein [Pseudomonas aeruginosa]MDI6671875.1 hypothetical protein [Pseudomonas aeruginosa]